MVTNEEIKPSGIKIHPYFGKGVLAFEKSGHTLTRDKAYYVCSKKQNRACVAHEIKTINAENLERKFSRLAKTFAIPQEYKDSVIKQTVRDIFMAFLENLLESPDFHDLIGITTEAMRVEAKMGDKSNFKKDVRMIREQVEKDVDRNTRLITAIFLGAVIVFAKVEPSESEMGRMLAYLSEKVYLSDEGDITKIFLCPLGDYIFQYLRKEMPKYIEPFIWFAATRMPEPPPFRTILKNVSIEGMGEMAPPIVLSTEVLARAFQIIEKIGSMTPEDSINALIYMENSPAFWVSTNFMAPKKKEKNISG